MTENSTHRHFCIHKPWGYLSQFINLQTKRKKKLLGDLDFDFPEGTMAIGRLDVSSEGLLLLTTDGMESEIIRSSKFEKEYHVQVDGEIDDAAMEKLREGVEIGFKGVKYITKPGKANRLERGPNIPIQGWKIRGDHHGPTSWVSIIIREGKFRQVRKMTAAVGFPTLRLIRVRIGSILLEDLKAGGVVEVDTFHK